MERRPDRRIQGSYEDLLEKARQARAAGRADIAVWMYSRIVDRISSVLPDMGVRDEQLLDHLITAADELQAVLEWMGDHAYALSICEQMSDLDPDDPLLWKRRAATERIHLGDVEGGLVELRILAEEHPMDFWHPLELAARLLELGRLDEAQEALEEASRRASRGEERGLLHWTRFRVLKEQGRLQEAADAWEEACRHDPFYEYMAQWVYRMFIVAGDYASALSYLNRERNPLMAGYYRGLIAHYQGREDRAKRAWRRVIRERPEEYQVGREAWAMAQIRLGNLDAALDLLASLTRQGYATDRIYAAAGLVWAIQGSLGGAMANLDLALRTHRQAFGPRALLPMDLWMEFDDLVPNEDIKGELRRYFVSAASD